MNAHDFIMQNLDWLSVKEDEAKRFSPEGYKHWQTVQTCYVQIMQQGAAALGMTEDAYQTLIRKIADRVAVGIVQQNSTGHTAKFLKEAPAAPGRQVFRLPDTTPKHPKKQGGKVRAAMAVKLGKGKPIK